MLRLPCVAQGGGRHPQCLHHRGHAVQCAQPTVHSLTSGQVNYLWQRPGGPRHRQAAVVRASNGDGVEDNDDDDTPVAGKAMRVERLLANLGYGKRKECQTLVKTGRVLGKGDARLKVGDKVFHEELTLDGEPLDPPFPLTVLLHKPVGYVVTSPDDDRVVDPKVYDLLPYRWGCRKPFLSAIGRLDKDTSGLLVLTDDGQLVHRVKSPKQGIWKVYEARLAEPLTPKQMTSVKKRFASGKLMLQGELTPLLPAAATMIDEYTVQLAICEGRYHQVRRMFTALGYEVVALHRSRVGGLTLDDVPSGEFRVMTPADIDQLFNGPTSEQVLAKEGQASSHGSAAQVTEQASSPEKESSADSSESQSPREREDALQQIADRQDKQVQALTSGTAKPYRVGLKRMKRTSELKRIVS